MFDIKLHEESDITVRGSTIGTCGLVNPEKYKDVISEANQILIDMKNCSSGYNQVFDAKDHSIGYELYLLIYDDWGFIEDMPELPNRVKDVARRLKGAEAFVRLGTAKRLEKVTMTGESKRTSDGCSKPYKFQCITSDGKLRWTSILFVMPYCIQDK